MKQKTFTRQQNKSTDMNKEQKQNKKTNKMATGHKLTGTENKRRNDFGFLPVARDEKIGKI